MISRLHFITHHDSVEGHLQQVQDAIKAGVNWIQVRIKEKPDGEIAAALASCILLAKKENVTLILNDRVHLSTQFSADGVHVGQEDMAPAEVRKVIGQKIIGGTANTIDQIKKHVEGGVDYVGVGPFRFTGTKKKLSPVLGVEGYQTIIDQLQQDGIVLPVIAIGGITPHDVPAILKTGVHGIAVSGGLLQAGMFDQKAFLEFQTMITSAAGN